MAALGTGLREATVEDVLAAVDRLRVREDGKPASASTVATHVAVVKSLLRFAHRVGYTRFNAGELLKVKAPPVGPPSASSASSTPSSSSGLRVASKSAPACRWLLCRTARLRVGQPDLGQLRRAGRWPHPDRRSRRQGRQGAGSAPASVGGWAHPGSSRRRRGSCAVFTTRHGAISERTVNVIIKAAAKRAGLPASLW